MRGSGTWHAAHAWLGRIAGDVLIEVADGRITGITENVVAPPGAIRLPGLTLPGFANAHSHAFQRRLRGRTHDGAGDFWTWREVMFEEALRLEPDSMYEVTRQAYEEMVHAGITTVGEFHYLHHRRDGGRYDNANAMGDAVIAAARDVGIRLTLLDTCYLFGGVDGRPLAGGQVRFGDGSVGAWAERVRGLSEADGLKIGCALHSVRAVDPNSMRQVVALARIMDRPLHIHVAEQPAEVDDCMRVHGCSPVQLCAREDVLGATTTAVHAIHLDEADILTLAASHTNVCVCSTTERELGDRVGQAAALEQRGVLLCTGSDSNAVIDPFDEMRGIELDQRRALGRRGIHSPQDLLAAGTVNGMRALGWDGGVLTPGRLADFVSVAVEKPDLGHLVFASDGHDISNVVIGGMTVVSR